MGLRIGLYLCITMLPIFFHDSPYHPAYQGRLVLRHGDLLGRAPRFQDLRFKFAWTQARQLGRLVENLRHRTPTE